ncbi:argininosuccinate lyase [Nocardia donostiensis]|uniref:ArsA family ATPase n=1 Tax=Nocardia donostiensis TaxID=1538463 RepID=UPI0009DADF5A|nr:ArsA family ATPase [Nocardia donostiensis]OQS12424.1 argininosuccinate lyase [Nocardia donostiensis]
MFIGKGGVGKTTLACATAMSYARAGQRVLVASLDQAHSLGDALGFRFPHDPGTVAGIAPVLPGLEVIEVDSLALLEDRFAAVTRLLAAEHGHDHGIDLGALDPAELTGLPGVQELLMLVEITQFAQEDHWDVIVVDCPPSADMLRIVTAPDTLLGYLERIWPSHERVMSAIGTDLRRAVLAGTTQRIVDAVSEVRDLLADRERTGARLITVAERVAVAETARVRSAAALLGLRLDAVVVNKVLPPVPESGPEPEHPAVAWYLTRRGEQLDVISGLRRAMPEVAVLVAGHTGPEPVGVGPLAALSCVVADGVPGVDSEPGVDNNPAGGTAGFGEPVVRWESGAGLQSVYAMRMHLPVADPATLRLGRVEDDLIVGADGIRRRLRLAPVLRRCTVSAAELDDGYLVVRFRPDPQAWPQ